MAYRFRYLDNFDNIFDKNVGSSIEFELDLANTLTKCQQLLTIRYSLPAPPVGLYCTHKMSSLLSKGGTTIGAGGGACTVHLFCQMLGYCLCLVFSLCSMPAYVPSPHAPSNSWRRPCYSTHDLLPRSYLA